MYPRPKDKFQLDFDSLNEGDILAVTTNHYLHDIVKLITGGDYAHVAQYAGKDSETGEHTIIHSTLSGVGIVPSSAFDDCVLIDVYRLKELDESEDLNWAAIRKQMEDKIGLPYADQLAVLMGAVIAGSRIPKRKAVRKILRMGGAVVLIKLLNWLRKLKKGPKEEGMHCVQLLTTSYYEAIPHHKYGIMIDIGASAGITQYQESYGLSNSAADLLVDGPSEREFLLKLNAGTGEKEETVNADEFLERVSDTNLDEIQDDELEAGFYILQQDILDGMQNCFGEEEFANFSNSMQPLSGSQGSLGSSSSPHIMAGSKTLPLGSCSPFDIQTSPNLKYLGCIREPKITPREYSKAQSAGAERLPIPESQKLSTILE